MKKTATLLLSVILFIHVKAQTPVADYLNVNDINARFNADGSLFSGFAPNFNQGFEAPKGGGIHTFNGSALWIGGYDAGNNLKLAGQTYKQTGTDYFSGPLDSTGATNSSTIAAFNKVWKINKCTIDSFNVYCQTGLPVGYVVPNVIKTWPGISPFGMPLAPFHDANGDGKYNSDSCDYPLIKGDQALFFVFNDNGGAHTETGGTPIGVEIQVMAYAYNCSADSALYNTIFSNYRIINKSAFNLDSAYIGNWSDFDIGAYNDDFVGCDVTRSAMYAYNGDSFDGPLTTGAIYGSTPPAQAVVFLRGPYADADNTDNPANTTPNGFGYGDGITDNERLGLSTFLYYNNTFNPLNGNPSAADDYYQFMTATWKNGQSLKYGGDGTTGTVNAKYMFPGNTDPMGFGTGMVPQASWDEMSSGNMPGDRRGLGSVGPFTLVQGGVQEIDFAYVFARSSVSGGNLASVALMQNRIDNVKQKFNAGITPCGCANPNGIADLSANNTFSFYPNPASADLTVKYRGIAKEYSIKVYDVTGKLVKQIENISSGDITINISDLNSGLYLLNIYDAEKAVTKRFVKQ